MKLQSKTLLLSIVCIFFVFSLVGISFLETKVQTIQAKTSNQITELTKNHMKADMMHDAIRSDVLTAILSDKESDSEKLKSAEKDLEEHTTVFKQMMESNLKVKIIDGNLKSAFQEVSNHLTDYSNAAKKVIQTIKAKEDSTESYQGFEKIFSVLEGKNEEVTQKISALSKTFEIKSIEQSRFYDLVSSIISLLAILCVGIIPVYFYRRVFKPIGVLTGHMLELAKGNTNISLAASKSKDEVGQITASVLYFKDTIDEKRRLQEENLLERAKTKEEAARLIWEQEEMIGQQISSVIEAFSEGDFTKRVDVSDKSGVVLKLSEGMNQIGESCLSSFNSIRKVLDNMSTGNLSEKMTGQYKGIFEEVKHSINLSIERFSSIVVEMKKTSETINSTSLEIAKGSRDLSQRAEDQATSLEETNASMEELTNKIRQNTESAKEANNLSRVSSDIATQGNKVVQATIESMKKIQDSSQKVADIIATVDEIAFQTNLLALNAAVEAARAGDAGKGFAVVSSEVRSLAGRSATAARDIKDLISNSIEQVNSGMKLVVESGNSLGEIVKSIHSVSECISLIAQASEAQTQSIEEVSSVIAVIDSSTQKNATLAQQNSIAIDSMTSQGQNLRTLVSSIVLEPGLYENTAFSDTHHMTPFFNTTNHGAGQIGEEYTVEDVRSFGAEGVVQSETFEAERAEENITPSQPIKKPVFATNSSHEGDWQSF